MVDTAQSDLHALGHVVVFEAVDLASVEAPRAALEYLALRRDTPWVRAPIYIQPVVHGQWRAAEGEGARLSQTLLQSTRTERERERKAE